MKQTAVEWLYQRILAKDIKAVFEQAKEMEKEQIIDAYRDGRSDQQSNKQSKFYNRMSEDYYNKTFKQQKDTDDTL